MNKFNKGIAPLIAIIIAVVVIFGGGATYYFVKKTQPVVQTQQNQQNNKPSIKVVSPNGGEVWVRGQTYNITWTSTGLSSDIRIGIGATDYSYPGGRSQTVAVIPVSQSSYSWVIPNDPFFSGNKFKIDIFIPAYDPATVPNAHDSSDNYFSIVTP